MTATERFSARRYLSKTTTLSIMPCARMCTLRRAAIAALRGHEAAARSTPATRASQSTSGVR